MFPRSFSYLIIIAKTINDSRLSFDFLKINTMKPKVEEYRGKEIEYGFNFSNSINHFIISGERQTILFPNGYEEVKLKILLHKFHLGQLKILS